MDPIQKGFDPQLLERLNRLNDTPTAPPPAPVSEGCTPEEPARPPTVALRDSQSAALFRRSADPRQTGAEGAPSVERPRIDPGVKSAEEILGCKVILGSVAAFAAGLATPLTFGTVGAAAAGKAVIGGVGAAGALTICENAQRSNNEGAGGAPGAR